jgi:protein disulfide-isomerase A6
MTGCCFSRVFCTLVWPLPTVRCDSVNEAYGHIHSNYLRLAPAYKSAAKKLRDIAVVAAVNCDASENRELCGQHGVQGFPTIKLIYPLQDKKKPGQLKKTSIGKINRKSFIIAYSSGMNIDYQGERSADALVEAVTNRLPTWAITGLTAGDSTIARANIDEFLTNQDKHKPLGLPEDLAKAIFFTDKPTVAPLIRSLGLTLHGKLRVGVSRDPEIAKRFKITKTPALLAFPAGATEADDAIRYEGK